MLDHLVQELKIKQPLYKDWKREGIIGDVDPSERPTQCAHLDFVLLCVSSLDSRH